MGDFSRNTHDPKKHYSGVLMQQGRVQLDADWNEQVSLQLYRTEREARDVIGLSGVPKKTNGFLIGLTPNKLDLTIAPGRIYVDGLLCESEATPVSVTFVQNAANRVTIESLFADGAPLRAGQWVEISAANKPDKKLLKITAIDATQRTLTFDSSVVEFQNAGQARVRRIATFLTQPDYPGAAFPTPLTSPLSSPPASPLSSPPKSVFADGLYLIFLDAWKREITALDDAHIREVALGGPDTATRLKNVWQVRVIPVANPVTGAATCDTGFKEWDDLVAPSSGRMNARAKPPADEKDLCLLPPTAGFTRLENQLYRVEVHKGGNRQTARFKWSRDNAVVRTSIANVNGQIVTVADIGRDEVMSFAGGQWVEITDEESILKSVPRQLVQIESIDPATGEVTLKSSAGSLAGRANLQLVRWEQTGAAAGADGVLMTNPANDNWVDLESGVQVQFAEGTYRAGDYWLIPARTATGEIEWPPFAVPNVDPIPQQHVGVRHHFARLALVEAKGGVIKLADCRQEFPSLTGICAEDICVDNDVCRLPNVNNLQDMIDRLCRARDLRFHNKHLHGWGIVCGLQVECGPDAAGTSRRHVTVRSGYALDCEGNDIILDRAETLDLVRMIEEANIISTSSPPASPLTSPPGGFRDGEVCLILETDERQKRRYRVEKFQPPKNVLKSIFEGTLLMDFYQECVQSLVDFYREEFQPKPEDEKELVGPARKRASTFANLFVQYANPVNGSYVFLSGEKGQEEKNLEDTILRNSYNKLRERLQSHTFCAMFEGARPFPDYPFSKTGITTIFGRGQHTRLRIHPNSRIAYTLGGSTNKIGVYDLTKDEMVAELEFPGGTSALVEDVAVSQDGRRLFAIATLKGKDTMFAVADISGLNHTFRKPVVVCDVLLTTIGTSRANAERVFAIGKGKGLYEINPENVETKPTPRNAFNAVGHIVFSEQQDIAFATASSATSATEVYDRVLRLNLRGTTDPNPSVTVLTAGNQPAAGRDDIALVEGGQAQKLYVVVDEATGQATKRVIVFTTNAATGAVTTNVTDLGENTGIRLGHNSVTNHMIVAYEDSYRVALLEPTKDALVPRFHQPVQISPLGIVAARSKDRVYVLNSVSNTITAIPADKFAPGKELDLKALVEYRAGVIEAFTDLGGALLQYLKDCFCDHLLVNCPTCDENDKLYLACVEIKAGQVFKVCNFSLRKYVKSFPTVEYWLSAVPIIPLVSKAVEMFCCAVLPNFFGGFKAKRPPVTENGAEFSQNRVKGEQIRGGVKFTRETDFRGTINNTVGRVSFGRQIVKDSVTDRVTPKTEGTVIVNRSDVVGLRVEEARQQLEANNITVERVEKYEPSKGVRNLGRFVSAPATLRAGSRVTLIEKDGVVRLLDETPGFAGELRSEIEDNRRLITENMGTGGQNVELQKEVVSLRTALQQMQKSHEEALAVRDKEIDDLKVRTKDFQANVEAVRDLQVKMERLSPVIRRTTTEAEKEEKPKRKRRTSKKSDTT